MIRHFGWSAAAGIRPVTILFGSLLALLPVAIYAWYRVEAFQKEAAINVNLNNHIGQLKLILAERAREAAEAKRLQKEEADAIRERTSRQRQARHHARRASSALLQLATWPFGSPAVPFSSVLWSR